jgi:hypothetical protein
MGQPRHDLKPCCSAAGGAKLEIGRGKAVATSAAVPGGWRQADRSMAGLLPPAPMPCRGGQALRRADRRRAAASTGRRARCRTAYSSGRTAGTRKTRGLRPRASARRGNQTGGMAEEHQHEQKKRRVGQILDQAVQRHEQQIADQAAKHAPRLPCCRISGCPPGTGRARLPHSTATLVEMLPAARARHFTRIVGKSGRWSERGNGVGRPPLPILGALACRRRRPLPHTALDHRASHVIGAGSGTVD